MKIKRFLVSLLLFMILIPCVRATIIHEGSIAPNSSFLAKLDQTITTFTDMTKTYGTADFSPGAKASPSNLPVTYTSSNSTVATILNNGTSNAKIHIVGAGVAQITASQAGDATYNPAPNLTKTLTVNKASQTITFNMPTGITYITPDFSPASVNSGLPISYYTSDPLIIAIVNGKLHVTGVGTVTIIASQEGNQNYNAAIEISRTFTVSKANQTLTAQSSITKTFGDPDFDLSISASSGLPVSYSSSSTTIATITYSSVKIKGAGTTTIQVSQPGNAYYNAITSSFILTVDKAIQTITFPTLDPVDFGYPDFNAGATSSAHLGVTYTTSNASIATVVDNLIHIISAGDVQIIAKQPGNSNYSAAPDVIQVLTVKKASQSITFESIPDHQWGDADFSLNCTNTSGLPISLTSNNTSVATIVSGKIHITGVGSVDITASQPGSSNYLAAANVTQSLLVKRATQAITFTSLPEKAYTDPDFQLNATSGSGLPITYTCNNAAVATISGNTVHLTGTGIAYITAKQAGNSYFLPAGDVQQMLVVKNSGQTITFNALPVKSYGDADFPISASSSSGLPVYFISDNISVATISGNTIHIIGGGTANIIAMQDGNPQYAAATPVLQPITVNKINQTITFPALPIKTYLDPSFVLLAASSSGLPISFTSSDENTAIVIDNRIYITGVGTTTITATQGGNSNYNLATSVSQVLTVTKSSQTIAFNSIASKTYGDEDFNPGALTSSFLPITYSSNNPLVATIVNNKVHIVGVGSATITASQGGNQYYWAASNVSQTLIVVKASQSIEFESIPSVKYGSPDFSLYASSSTGLAVTFSSSNASVATVTNGIVHVLNAGFTTITAIQSGNSLFNAAAPVSQTLIVEKADQIIIFDSIYPKTYGDADFNPEAICGSGLPVIYSIDNPNVAVIKNGKVHIIGSGIAAITATQIGNSNFNPAESVERIIQIDKAKLTVIPTNVTRNYHEYNPEFSCTYTGFINGDNESVLIKPALSTLADYNSFPGTYDITASGAMASNYEFIYQKGILLVLGTMPLKTAKPEGSTYVCINPGIQEYKTAGATFGSSYIWIVKPAEAGQITTSGKNLTINFKESFTGKVAIAVKSSNTQGIGETSDTLFVYVMAKPKIVDVLMRGAYCKSNSFGDSIKIKESEKLYQYQLKLNGENQGDAIQGDGGTISWFNLKAGSYSISENICNEVVKDNLLIRETDPISSKPQLIVKWEDVIVCLDKGDSIESFRWYKNGAMLYSENKQYLWTQKNEGFYYVETIDPDGCIYTSDSINIIKGTKGQLYPNPNDGNFKLSFSSVSTGKLVVRITNVYSTTVRTFNFNKSEEYFETDIAVPEIKSGTYFVDILLDGKRIYYDKFIRQ